MQERVQRFGGNLAAMVIPNIGAFLAWGLITAFVIPSQMLPGNLGTNPYQLGQNQFIELVR